MVILVFAFKILVKPILQVTARLLQLVEVSAVGSAVLGALVDLATLVGVEGVEENILEVLVAPVSREELEESLKGVEVHGDVVALEIH